MRSLAAASILALALAGCVAGPDGVGSCVERPVGPDEVRLLLEGNIGVFEDDDVTSWSAFEAWLGQGDREGPRAAVDAAGCVRLDVPRRGPFYAYASAGWAGSCGYYGVVDFTHEPRAAHDLAMPVQAACA